MPIVSVVIPVFNGAPFVSKAVESVRAQTIKEVEIIVVDDGSTDGTQAVLAELEKNQCIIWFQQEHGGPARSRNRGIAAARGEFVALLDCDDVWLPDKLEAQLTLMQTRRKVGVVHTDYEVVDQDGSVLERVRARQSTEPLVQAFVGGHAALPSTLLVRREVLEKVGSLNPELYGSEDSDLTIRLYAATQFDCVDRVLVQKLLSRRDVRVTVFDEASYQQIILSSRERFLEGLERMQPLTAAQRTAMDSEWANYFLGRGNVADRAGRRTEARRFYWQAITKAPFRLRGYTRVLRTFIP